jgi:biotin carboxylase
MGARGCIQVDNMEELEAAVVEAIRISPTGRAIVEEYMDGAEFSVDARVHEGTRYECGFADRYISCSPYFVEIGHTIPADIGADTKQQLMRCFDAGVQALGLTEGAVKGDLKYVWNRPMIGEIAARLSGGFMSGWTFPYSNGFEVTKAAIEVAMGKQPRFPWERKGWASAERAVISIPGTIRAITGVEEAAKMPGIKDVFMRVTPGSKVTFPKNNVEKCGNVISMAQLKEDATNAAKNAANSILIRLEPGDPDTEAFLAQPVDTKHPPSVIEEYPDGTLHDYVGRNWREVMEIMHAMTGKRPVYDPGLDHAVMRGGYQGGVYYLDTHDVAEAM